MVKFGWIEIGDNCWFCGKWHVNMISVFDCELGIPNKTVCKSCGRSIAKLVYAKKPKEVRRG